MEQATQHKSSLILSVAPTTRGFGYCVTELPGSLIDWGSKAVQGDKNVESIKKVRTLIQYFRPSRVVLQDLSKPDCRRGERIMVLNEALIALAKECGIRVVLLSRSEIRKQFFGTHRGTKFEIAVRLANRFPEELGSRMPRKRKPWMSEDSRMDIFDAISIGVTYAASQ
jgi:hypothetical protein